MLLERYTYEVSAGFLQYKFYSEGSKGRIEKMVVFTYLMTLDGVPHYNLAFGDYDRKTGLFDDLAVSDNGDRDKILATVAFTAVEFADHFHGCRIIIAGSTFARTRLYQMRIGKYYWQISQLFEIQGVTVNGNVEPFKTGENYRVFLASRR